MKHGAVKRGEFITYGKEDIAKSWSQLPLGIKKRFLNVENIQEARELLK